MSTYSVNLTSAQWRSVKHRIIDYCEDRLETPLDDEDYFLSLTRKDLLDRYGDLFEHSDDEDEKDKEFDIQYILYHQDIIKKINRKQRATNQETTRLKKRVRQLEDKLKSIRVTEPMSNLLSLVEDVKEKLNDKEYKDIMDTMKELHESVSPSLS